MNENEAVFVEQFIEKGINTFDEMVAAYDQQRLKIADETLYYAKMVEAEFQGLDKAPASAAASETALAGYLASIEVKRLCFCAEQPVSKGLLLTLADRSNTKVITRPVFLVPGLVNSYAHLFIVFEHNESEKPLSTDQIFILSGGASQYRWDRLLPGRAAALLKDMEGYQQEPDTLEKMLNTCKHLGGDINTLAAVLDNYAKNLPDFNLEIVRPAKILVTNQYLELKQRLEYWREGLADRTQHAPTLDLIEARLAEIGQALTAIMFD